MSVPEAQPGDTYLLFGELPYDFLTGDLPLPVGPNVYLDYTPHQSLAHACPSALADYVLPGYNLNSGVPNCCFRRPGSSTDTFGLAPRSHFFASIIALRLRAPIAIRVEGQFTLAQDGRTLEHTSLYHLTSAWQPRSEARYSLLDVRCAAAIARRLLRVLDPSYGRVATGVLLFAQVTTGQSRSFQMAYLGLFVALEALFAPKDNKAATLARRAGRFLSAYTAPVGWSVEEWLEKEYKEGRNKLAHGVEDVAPWETQLRPPRREKFGRLHEITRMCLLGFMSLSTEELRSISAKKGTSLQTHLDSLAPASGRFMRDQQMWSG